MTTRLLAFLTCGLVLGHGLPADGAEMTTLNGSTAIRVLLDRESRAAVVRSPAGLPLYVRGETPDAWVRLGPEARIKLVKKPGSPKISVNGIEAGAHELYIRGGSLSDEPFQYQHDSYRGSLKVVRKGNSLLLANIVPLEDYLIGTVGAEMSPDWEIEALKAQVVASRTYAFYMMRNPRSPLYDVESTVNDQVYGGLRAPSKRVAEAVAATKGEFLAQGGKPIKAFFHSRCGGRTETPTSVWNRSGGGVIAGVPCPFCKHFPYTWSVALPIARLLEFFGFPANPFARITLFSTKARQSSRITEVSLEADGEKRTLSADKLRSLVGYSKIKSTMFDWKLSANEVEFTGVGAGHGVGMCQWGAKYLAKKGKSYREILAYYYPGSQLVQ